jgi:hypothetical protein
MDWSKRGARKAVPCIQSLVGSQGVPNHAHLWAEMYFGAPPSQILRMQLFPFGCFHRQNSYSVS